MPRITRRPAVALFYALLLPLLLLPDWAALAGHTDKTFYLCGISNPVLSETPCRGLTVNLVGAVDEEFEITLTEDISGTEYHFHLYLASATSGGSPNVDASLILDEEGVRTTLAALSFTVTNYGGPGPSYVTIPYSDSVAGIDPDASAGDQLILSIVNRGPGALVLSYGGRESTITITIAGPPSAKVTAISPQNAALDIAANAVVSATFDAAIDFSTVSTWTFTVRGTQTGVYEGVYSNGSLVFDPDQDFRPGERIVVNLSSGLQSTMGTAVAPYAWSFRAAVEAGPGTFVNSRQSLGSAKTNVVALGDLDGDGDLDAFVGNDPADGIDKANRIWLNDGSGGFSDSGQRLGDLKTRGVALGDLDGDGDLDAFVGNVHPHMQDQVWFNDGSGTFVDSGQSLGNEYSRDVALGDVDGDGDLDAVVATIDADDKLWLNDGNGTFTDSGHGLDNQEGGTVGLGDLDGDGDLDAFIGNGLWSNAPDTVWLNNGTGLLSDTGQRLGDFDSSCVDLGDVDADGDLDAVVGQISGQPNKIWLNDGAANFTDSGQNLGGSDSMSLALGDVDRDGDLDIVVGNGPGVAMQPINKLWLNDGAGNFTDSGQNLSSSPNLGLALGDLDGDGALDAFLANEGGNEVWLNRYILYLPLALANTNS